MTQYILRRLVHSLFIVWAVATLVFFLLQMIPGDPVAHMLGEQYTPEAAQALREKLGLHEPLPVQYANWVGHAVRGDLGRSIATGEPVSDAIASALPKTLSLALVSFAISLLIAIPTGIVAALKRGGAADYVVSVMAFIGVSMPSFWFGIMLVIVFAVNFGWLPAIGYTSIADGGVSEWLQHLLLPAIACGAAYSAILMRFVRAGLLEVLGNDYIRTARAKGLK
ncbi:MAG: ABC transporter permease, partial [Thermomicrobiales bacterium]